MGQDASELSSNGSKCQIYGPRTQLNVRDDKRRHRRLPKAEVDKVQQVSFACARSSQRRSTIKLEVEKFPHGHAKERIEHQQVLLALRSKAHRNQQAGSADRGELRRDPIPETTNIKPDAEFEDALIAMRLKLREQSCLIRRLSKLERRLLRVKENTENLRASQLRCSGVISEIQSKIVRRQDETSKADAKS